MYTLTTHLADGTTMSMDFENLKYAVEALIDITAMRTANEMEIVSMVTGEVLLSVDVENSESYVSEAVVYAL